MRKRRSDVLSAKPKKREGCKERSIEKGVVLSKIEKMRISRRKQR